MGVTDLLQLAGQFGPMGLMVAYMMWQKTRDDKLREADIVSREKLAGSLAVLSAAVGALTGRGNV
jgi:hypothetical protein